MLHHDGVVDIHASFVDDWCMFVVLIAKGAHAMVIGTSMKLKHARVRRLSPRRGRGGTEGGENIKTVASALTLKEGSLPIEESNILRGRCLQRLNDVSLY